MPVFCLTLMPTRVDEGGILHRVPYLTPLDYTNLTGIETLGDAAMACGTAWTVAADQVRFKLHVLEGPVLAPEYHIRDLFAPGVPGILYAFAAPSEEALFTDLIHATTLEATDLLAQVVVNEAADGAEAQHAAAHEDDRTAARDIETDGVVQGAPQAAFVVREAIPTHLVGRIDQDVWDLILLHHRGALVRLRKEERCDGAWVDRVVEQARAGRAERQRG